MDRDFAPATAVIVPNSARTIYISGIVGDNEDGSFGDFRTQCFLVFEKIAKVLQAAHPDFKSAQEAWASVFEVTAYHVGSLPDHLPIELEVGVRSKGLCPATDCSFAGCQQVPRRSSPHMDFCWREQPLSRGPELRDPREGRSSLRGGAA